MDFQINPLGDHAMLVQISNRIDPKINDQVIALHSRLANIVADKVLFFTPAFCSLGIGFDPETISYDALAQIVQEQFEQIQIGVEFERRLIRIPVCYSTTYGIDLEHVEATTGLDREQIIQLHTSKTYQAHMLGFLPGFAYLGSVDPSLRVERKTEPRLHVAAGSVGLAGEQTGVYPCDAPGGWQIIGRSPVSLVLDSADNQFLISPGDQVQFYSIDQAEFDSMSEKESIAATSKNALLKQPAVGPKEPIQIQPQSDLVSLHFKTAGLRTTVQDFGRTGHQHLGIPSGGAMDRFSAAIANRLVGNADHAAVVEISLMGPAIEIKGDCKIAITGADLSPKIDGQTAPMWETISISGCQRISFGSRKSGCRSYLAIAGEFMLPTWLGSVSPSRFGTGSTTQPDSLKGQTITITTASQPINKRRLPPSGRPVCLADNQPQPVTRVIPMWAGIEWDWFSEQQRNAFLAHQFQILPNSNSMGYRLSSFTNQALDLPTVISSPVVPGTIQITSSGQAILLMRDAQTTGGYPRIGNVCHAALNDLAQLCPGDFICFKLTHSAC